jgi:hypothetical protein
MRDIGAAKKDSRSKQSRPIFPLNLAKARICVIRATRVAFTSPLSHGELKRHKFAALFVPF